VAVDLDLDGVERTVGELLGRHPIVRKKARVALARPLESLDVLLDARQVSVARMREEHLAPGHAHVGPDQIAAAEERDDLVGLAGMLEGAREEVAEARRHRHEGHRQPDRGRSRGAHRRVAADREEMGEGGAARHRPLDELAQRAKCLHARLVAFPREPLSRVSGDGHRAASARARRHDDLNPGRHRAA